METADTPKPREVDDKHKATATDNGAKLSNAGNGTTDAITQARDSFTRAPLPERIADIYKTPDVGPQTPAIEPASSTRKHDDAIGKLIESDQVDKKKRYQGDGGLRKDDPIAKLIETEEKNGKNKYRGDGGLRHGQPDGDSRNLQKDKKSKPTVEEHVDQIGNLIRAWDKGDGTTITNKEGNGSIKLLTGDVRHFGAKPEDNYIESPSGDVTMMSDLRKKGLEELAKGLDKQQRNAPVDAKAVEDSVDAIHGARGTFTTDSGAINKALTDKSEADLRAIQARYKEKFGTPLRDDLKHDFDLPILGDAFGKGQKAEALLDHRDPIDLGVERSHLSDTARTSLSPASNEALQDQMEAFEERGAREHLSADEIGRTYREVSKVLDSSGDKMISESDRKKIAMQIMDNAADPKQISQDKNNTCNVTTLETAMYAQSPSEAARIVGDITRSGIYVDRSGVMIKSNPGSRTDAANVYPCPDGTRSHASEIYQIAAVNLSYKQRGVDRTYDQIKIPPPQNATDNGERLYDNSKNPPVEVKDADGEFTRSPDLLIGDLVEAHKAITGKDTLQAIQSDSYFGPQGDQVTNIKSEQQLNDKLAEVKKSGRFPLIIGVNTENEPLWTDSGGGAAGGSGGAHVITVTDYSPGPPAKVNVDNEWDSKADYQGKKMMSTQDLFTSMQPTSYSRQKDFDELTQSRKEGRVDFKKEIDYLRLEHSGGSAISGADFQKQHEDLTNRVIADVQKRGDAVTAQEKSLLSDKLAAAGTGMTVQAQLDSLSKVHDANISNTFQFDSNLAYLAHRILGEKKQIESTPASAATVAEYANKVKNFKDYVKQLPREDQDFVTENLKRWGDKY